MIEDIGKITVSLLLLLAVFLFTTRSKNKTANYYFGVFLLVISFDLSALFLKDLYSQYSVIDHLRNASAYLQMPLLYLYVKNTCFTNSKQGWLQLAHAIPFLGFFALLQTMDVTRAVDILYIVTTQIQYGVYFIAVFWTLARYKRIRLANYSVHSGVYKWLKNTSILFLIANFLVLLRLLFEAQNLEVLNVIIFAFALIIICWFVIKTMRTPYLFTGIDHQIESPVKKTNPIEKVKSQQQLDELSNYMTTHKPYLDNALTLQDLAKQTHIPERQLSYLINQVLGKHFYDYINTYRIEEAQRLLADKDLNIQQIMYEVGFNSKSSFNTAFKKKTGQTPSLYRNSLTERNSV